MVNDCNGKDDKVNSPPFGAIYSDPLKHVLKVNIKRSNFSEENLKVERLMNKFKRNQIFFLFLLRAGNEHSIGVFGSNNTENGAEK